MGSGAFLVAAATISPTAYERALVDEGRRTRRPTSTTTPAPTCAGTVAERCLAGVDRNPTAVALARLSLWLTTLARGKPLTFLDHRLRVGDSLLGAWPADLARLSTRRSRDTRAPCPSSTPTTSAAAIATDRARCGDRLADRRRHSVTAVRAKDAAVARAVVGRKRARPVAHGPRHLWCAPLVLAGSGRHGAGCRPRRARCWPHSCRATARSRQTHVAARLRVVDHRRPPRAPSFTGPWSSRTSSSTRRARHARSPGFDAVLGNPPWEMLAARHGQPHPTARDADGRSAHANSFASSGSPARIRRAGRGHLNLYQPFVERALSLTRPGGRVGLVLPWGLAADDGTAALRARLLERYGHRHHRGSRQRGGPVPHPSRHPVHAGDGDARAGDRREFACSCGVRTVEELNGAARRATCTEPGPFRCA